MRILITGSNGLLGQKIVYQLLNAKEVFLATSLGVNRNDACPTDHYCSMDITNQVDIERVMNDADAAEGVARVLAALNRAASDAQGL
jgi:dTDP-4-dehydrorhamnose reductase